MNEIDGISKLNGDPSPSPSLEFLREVTAERLDAIIKRMGTWLPVQARRDGLQVAFDRAFDLAEKNGIEDSEHRLAHKNPAAWLHLTGKRESKLILRKQMHQLSVDGGEIIAKQLNPLEVAMAVEQDSKYSKLIEVVRPYFRDLDKAHIRLTLAAVTPFESLINKLPNGASQVVKLLLVMPTTERTHRLTDAAIGGRLFPAEGATSATGQRVGRRCARGRKLLWKALLQSPLPPAGTAEISLASALWLRIAELQDVEVRRAMWWRFFGSLADRIHEKPSFRDRILAHYDLPLLKEHEAKGRKVALIEQVFWIAVGAKTWPSTNTSLIKLGEQAKQEARRVRAELRTRLYLDGQEPEVLELLRPR